MKRITTKILCILIIAILSMSYFMPIISSAEFTATKYVACGDSIAYGYGLKNKSTESYAALVKNKYNIKDSDFTDLAVTGKTCEEFYQDIQTEKETAALKEADLITVSIGSNELLGLAVDAAAEVTGIDKNTPNFADEVKKAFTEASVLKKYTMAKGIYNFFTSEETKKQIDANIAKYETSWKSSIDYIKSINSDVTIVATEFYNPYYEVSLLSYDLGGFVDENIQKMNTILHNQSNSEQNYKIAKIYEGFNTSNPRITNVNASLSELNIDPHPNKAGHELIYTKVVDALANVETAKDIKTLTISDISNQKYTGEKIEPEIEITDGTKKLVKDTDFTVSYTSNTNVGEAKATIIGIGNYTGKTEKTFNIVNSDVKDISKVSVKAVENQTYTGFKLDVDVEITDGDYTLTKGNDYTLTYQNNVNVGQATINIKGIGNYSGSRTTSFTIVKKEINTVNINGIEEQKYTGTEIEPEVEMYNEALKLVKGTDYSVAYSNNIDVGTATVTVTGLGNYTGTASKTFEIVASTEPTTKDISTLTITNPENKIYTGKSLTPEVRITDGSTVLIKNTDYTIIYSNNVNVGTGKVTISGIGNYRGAVEKTFEITRKDIVYTTIEDIVDQNYTGAEIKPLVKIISDLTVLVEGKDYTLEYKNNINVGTATITIKGIGNYTGTTTKTFNIVNINQNNEKEQQKSDGSMTNGILPNTGTEMKILILIISTAIIGFCSYKLYKRNPIK